MTDVLHLGGRMRDGWPVPQFPPPPTGDIIARKHRMRKPSLPLALLLAVLTLIPMIAGCTPAQIADTLSVVESALISTGALLQPVNPGLAANLTLAGGVVKVAYDGYESYASAPAADKSTAAGKANQAILAAQRQLAAFLQAAKLNGNAEVSQYATAYVAVAATLMSILLNHLPKGPQSLIAAPNLPAPPASVKTPKQLKEFFNSQVPSEMAIR